MTDKLTSDEVFDILKGSMPIALAGYLMDALHPLGREGLEMVQAVREQAAAEERAKIVAWLHEAGYRQIADAIEAKDHLK
jgi:hypothetical protein